MMRMLGIKVSLLPMLALALLWAGTGAWAQDSAASPARNQDQAQVAQPPEGGVNWKGVGAGAGAVVTNLVYVPAKLVYGILGGIAGGAGYALTGGNKQVANSIWRSSLGGDYVLTPDMMTGKKPIYFSGPSEPTSAPTAAVNGASPPAFAPSTPASSPAPVSSSTLPATHTIDNGAGFVSSTGNQHPVNPTYNYGAVSPSAPKRAPLSDTSIE